MATSIAYVSYAVLRGTWWCCGEKKKQGKKRVGKCFSVSFRVVTQTAFRILIAMSFSFRLLYRDAIDQYSINSSYEAWAQARAQPKLSTTA